jgi:glycosyltransferase involved in cell wall biosynthesis
MRLAIVIPRFDREVSGGADRLVRGFATEGLRRNWSIEVLTSCAKDHYRWRNDVRPGKDAVDGIPVHRFPISSYDPELKRSLEVKLEAQVALRYKEQVAWLESGPHCQLLYEYLNRNGFSFDAIVTLPYANPLVQYAAWISPQKAILWPCLHDEPYAYMEPIRVLMETVWGVAFNSPEEFALAKQRMAMNIRRSAVLGVGVSLPSIDQKKGNRSTRTLKTPYLVYAGRLEAGKNLNQLYDYVDRYNRFQKSTRPIRLVVVGQGPLTPPAGPNFDFRGYVSDEELASIMGGALALCQPSNRESFSLTIMEAWLSGRPVLVSGASAVTRGHVNRSKAGLWYESFSDFAGAIDWLLAKSDQAKKMGQNGSQYVETNYNWPAVVDRFSYAFRQWKTAKEIEEERR